MEFDLTAEFVFLGSYSECLGKVFLDPKHVGAAFPHDDGENHDCTSVIVGSRTLYLNESYEWITSWLLGGYDHLTTRRQMRSSKRRRSIKTYA